MSTGTRLPIVPRRTPAVDASQVLAIGISPGAHWEKWSAQIRLRLWARGEHMRRNLARLLAIGLITAVAVTVSSAPASATVHEIVAQWCSGQDTLAPPGISGGSNADNFARPLNANGFIEGVVPFVGPQGPGLLINFNYDHPASKVVGTGNFIVVGQTPNGPLYLELIEPDPNFPAFKHCPRLATG